MIFTTPTAALTIGGDPNTVPTMAMTREEGQALLALLEQGPVTAAVEDQGQPVPLRPRAGGGGRGAAVALYVIDDSNTTRIDVDYHSHVPGRASASLRTSGARGTRSLLFGFLRRTVAPQSRAEYVSGGDVVGAGPRTAHRPTPIRSAFPMLSAPRTYDNGLELEDAVPGRCWRWACCRSTSGPRTRRVPRQGRGDAAVAGMGGRRRALRRAGAVGGHAAVPLFADGVPVASAGRRWGRSRCRPGRRRCGSSWTSSARPQVARVDADLDGVDGAIGVGR